MEFLRKHEWNAISDHAILMWPVYTLYCHINHARPGLLTFDLCQHTLEMKVDVTAGTELALDYLGNGYPAIYLASEHGRFLR